MSWNEYIGGLVLLLAGALLTNSQTLSGFYVDNGHDQTVAQEVISERHKREVEYELRNLFNLPERPRRITRRALLVRRSAPKFLLNVYRNVITLATSESSVQVKQTSDDEFYLTGQDINVIGESDLIMTFGAHNPHSGNASKTNRGKRIWFDVSEVPREEQIIAAEIWLYQSLDFNDPELNQVYTIAIYQVSKRKDGERIKQYVGSADTKLGREGWITINITETLQYWVAHPRENRGLFVAVYRANSNDRIMRPDDIGIVGALGALDKQPFMVGFFKNSNNNQEHVRSKRASGKKIVEITTANKNHPFTKNPIREKSKPCSLQTLYVSFKDLKWQDWIIAPEGFNAFYCSGACNFPLNSHMNATNHAIVQTLMHLMKPGKVPKPCCAPTKLSSISVLYFLDDSNVVLKKYKNMVVSSCGCH